MKRALVLVLVSGCAPLASLRPVSGVVPGNSSELGAGLIRLGKRPYVDEEPQLVGQAWVTHEPSKHFAFSLVAAFDDSAAAGGLAARWVPLRTTRVALGPELEAGYVWAAGSLGFALRTFGENWIYTAPRFGNIGFEWAGGIPVGVSIDASHGFVLRAELQWSWADFKYYNRRIHTAGGLVYQW